MKKLNNDALKALSGIEIALMEMNSKDRKDEEFTAAEFLTELHKTGQEITYDAAEKRLKRMAERKLLKFRLIPINGHHTRVYSKH